METRTVVSKLADTIQNGIYDFLSGSVMATGIVVLKEIVESH